MVKIRSIYVAGICEWVQKKDLSMFYLILDSKSAVIAKIQILLK